MLDMTEAAEAPKSAEEGRAAGVAWTCCCAEGCMLPCWTRITPWHALQLLGCTRVHRTHWRRWWHHNTVGLQHHAGGHGSPSNLDRTLHRHVAMRFNSRTPSKESAKLRAVVRLAETGAGDPTGLSGETPATLKDLDDGHSLVAPDAAVETIARLVKEDPDILGEAVPAEGLKELRELLARQLTEAEGQEVSPSDIFVAEGAATLLRGVLSQVAAGTEKSEVLLVGPCPELWQEALSFADARSFYPPVGQGDFAVLAEDVARHVSAQTSIV
ncbi:tfdB, partial [Symbiodinium sp. CCMP2456]